MVSVLYMLATPRTIKFEGESVREFLKEIRSGATKDSFTRKLKYFLEYVGVGLDEFLGRAKADTRWAEHVTIDDVEARRNQVSGSTISQVREALKHFTMNDMETGVSWAEIGRMMPRAKEVGSDGAPTVEEVRRIVESADPRMKRVILLLCSGGVGAGALDTLRWSEVEPVLEGNEVMAGRVTAYRGDAERDQTFTTPECYGAFLGYRRKRESAGKVVSSSSPLIRDNGDVHRYRPYRRKRKNPRAARPLSSLAIRNRIQELLWQVGLRSGDGRHEFKQLHGFRESFKTQAERVMKTIDVEKLLGHAEN